MWGPLVFRAGTSLVVAAVVGGRPTLQHPLFLGFVAIEAALSLVEGWYSRSGRLSATRARDLPHEQLPFILTGKQYLLARTVYQIIVLAWFASLTRTTSVLPSVWTACGAALMIAGISLRGWSMAALGERFRGFEVKAEARGLETTGPYAFVRHPSYLALMMIDVGSPLWLSVPYMALLVIVPGMLVLQRIRFEDQLLFAAYPNAYGEYASRVRRLIPGLY